MGAVHSTEGKGILGEKRGGGSVMGNQDPKQNRPMGNTVSFTCPVAVTLVPEHGLLSWKERGRATRIN